MKCPDCNSRLSEIKLGGDNWAYRCFKCGGFWVDSWTVNRLTTKTLNMLRRVGVDKAWIKGGKGACPLDGAILKRYSGEAVPPTIPVSRCVRCGKWWFPQDSLFNYKPAVEAKINYFQHWGVAGDLTGLALPILSLLVMVFGLGVGVHVARNQQQTSAEAVMSVTNVQVVAEGDGVAFVSFMTSQVTEKIRYRQVSENVWKEVVVRLSVSGYVAKLEGLVGDLDYVVEIGGNEYEFTYR